MKIRFLFLFLFLGVFSSSFSQTVQEWFQDGKLYFQVDPEGTTTYETFRQGEVVPSYDGLLNLHDIIRQAGITEIFKPFKTKHPFMQSVYQVNFSKIEMVDQVASVLKALPGVVVVEKVQYFKKDYVPNDYNSSNQYYIDIIDGEKAWDITKGSEDIVIAITDDAILITHEDLAANIWVNPGEIPGNGIDDDMNGYKDDINGWDVSDNDNNPNPPGNADASFFTHGTHVSGCASAVADNDKGIAGIGFKTKIMAVKGASSFSTGELITGGYDAVDYAIAANANVVNMSWGGGGGFSIIMQGMFNVGSAKGIIFVASAGNDGMNVSHYPSAYNHVISVGSSTSQDKVSSFSNFGPDTDVMSPGSSISSTVAPGPDTYASLDGTSMSSPITAGLCGLIRSINPDISADDVEACLKSGCDNIDSLNPNYVGMIGAGRINAFNTLLCVPRLAAPEALFHIESDTVCGGDVQFVNTSTNFPFEWFWDFGDGETSEEGNPLHVYGASGTYQVKLKVTNNLGTDSIIQSVTFEIIPKPLLNLSPLVDSSCSGDSIQFHVEGGGTYLWEPAYGLTDSAGPDPVAHIIGDILYSVLVTADNGCEESDTVRISLLSNPNPWAGVDKEITVEGDSVQITAFGDSVLWTPTSGLSCIDCPQPMAYPDTTTLYTLTDFGANGCNGTDQVLVEVSLPISIHPNELQGSLFSIYPNPAESTVFVKNAKIESKICPWSIYGIEGRLILEGVGLFDANGEFPISVGEFPNGVYFIKLKEKGQIVSSKFIINR